MPDFFDVARSQRGVSHFKSDPIPREALHQILEAATRAPSGSNRQPWRFVVVEDREVKHKLGELYLEGLRRSRGGASAPPPDGEPPRFTDTMEDVPVVVLPCVELWRIVGRDVYRGASIYPAVQNLAAAAARHRDPRRSAPRPMGRGVVGGRSTCKTVSSATSGTGSTDC